MKVFPEFSKINNKHWIFVLFIYLFLEDVLANLIFGDDLVILLGKENLLKDRSDVRRLKKILEDIGRHDLAIKLLICLASGEFQNFSKIWSLRYSCCLLL